MAEKTLILEKENNWLKAHVKNVSSRQKIMVKCYEKKIKELEGSLQEIDRKFRTGQMNLAFVKEVLGELKEITRERKQKNIGVLGMKRHRKSSLVNTRQAATGIIDGTPTFNRYEHPKFNMLSV